MPSIDERVVSMAFENAVFESRVATTMSTLSKLDSAIKNIGSTHGLQNIEAAANKVTLQTPMTALDKLRAKLGHAGDGAAQGLGEIDRAGNKVTLEGPSRAVDKLQSKMGQLSAGSTFSDIERASNQVQLSGLTRALDNVTNKFSVLQGAASVALGSIASQAVLKGGAFAKSFAFGPIQQGFEEYSTNLKSIQTILANTEGQQVSGLDAVKAHLEELNRYSDQTIYNFGEMAKNIGTFTAAGVDLPKATASIKGIANLAALSGSSSQQAATAMYQLSQAIAAGRVSLQDWNSVVNAGMGGAVFQKALMRTAVAMGALEKGAVRIDEATGKATVNGESFRNSIMARPGEESWLTSEVLTTTLKNFTGDMKEADLIAQGFTKTQAKAIMQQAATAKAAATEVKTLSQVFDIARETIGSGWSKTFQLVFGDFEEAKKTFTAFSNFLNGFINRTSDARNEFLEGWRELGGRETLIEGLKSAFEALMSVITPIKDAFRQIFPPTTSQQLFDLTKRFAEFAESLKLSPETADLLRRIFAGLFAVLNIGWSVIKQVAGVLFDLFGVVGSGSGGFLAFVASIGDFLVAVDAAISKGGALQGIFKSLGAVLAVPLEIVKALASAFFGLFDGADPERAEGVSDSMDKLNQALKPLRGVMDGVREAWEKFKDILGEIREVIEPAFTRALEVLGDFGNMVADVFKNMSWDNALAALQTGLIGGIFLKIKQALGGGLSDIGGGFFSNINDLLGGLTGNLEAMQKNLQAKTLLSIAAAIAVLAGGIFILSKIDPEALNRAMSAVAIGLGQLVAAMALLSKAAKGTAFIQMPIIAASLILLATAVTILAGAMKIMATMEWEELAKGLIGVGGAIAVIGAATRVMNPVQLLAAGLAMIPLATGMVILATAVKIFATLSWEDLVKGLLGAGAALLGVAMAMFLMPPTIILIGPGLLAVAFAMSMLAGAVSAFGSMDIKTLVQGLLGAATALVAIGYAVALIPPTVGLQAAGLILLAGALTGIAAVVGILGNMDIATLVKGIAAIGLSLVVLAGGLTLMAGSLPGTAALLGAAVALGILGPTLAFLGTLDWGTIFKGLTAIALVMGTIAVVGLVAAPALVAIGGALAVLGLGLLPVAGAMYLFAKALQLVGAEGTKAFAALLAAMGAFIVVFPKMVIDFVKGLVTILAEIVKLAPAIVTSLVSIITTLVDGIIALSPKVAEGVTALVTAVLNILTQNAPRLLDAGAKLLLAFLTGIKSHMPALVSTVVDVVVTFLNTLATQIPRLLTGGMNALNKFLAGVASRIPQVVPLVARMITLFLNSVTAKIPNIVAAGTNLIARFINSIANNIGKIIAAGTNLILKFLDGVSHAIPKIVPKALEVARKFLNGVADGLAGLADVGFKAIIRFLRGLERSIRENSDDLFSAGAGVADAIIDGLVGQFGKLGGVLRSALEKVFGLLPGWAKKILGIRSPSTVFAEIGKFTMQGFAKGVDDNQKPVFDSARNMAEGTIGTVKDTLGIFSPSQVMRDLGKEVGTGFKQGIEGSASEIRSAFSSLRDRLAQDIQSTRDVIKQETDQLKELQQDPAKNAAEIRELQASIRAHGADLTRLLEARRVLVNGLREEKKELIGLSKQYDKVVANLEAAEQKLEEAKRAHADFQTSLTSQYSKLPSIDDEATDKVAAYKQALAERATAVRKYAETLQRLRELGLDDTTYRMLLEQGTAGQEFASQLLAGGKDSVDTINQLDADLAAESAKLAKQAADNLYNAGIAAAQGLVDGLKAKQADLEKEMDNLAKMMVRSIKRQLGIRSPSRIFAEIGQFMMQGLSRGIGQGMAGVDSSMQSAANDVISSAQSAFSRIPSALEGIVDMDPVISPVLDLTQVEKEAERLSGLTNVTPITAAASYGQATAISDMQKTMAETDQAVQGGTTFNYEQNNYSPESLSDVEIYRQTKNQLSQVKSALGLVS